MRHGTINSGSLLTIADVRNAISVGGNLSYNSSTGVISYSMPSFVTSVAGRTGAVTISSADITDATDANTVSKIVKRDSSGNFAAGTITASLSGNATTSTTASSASKLSTARAISHSGDVSGSATFDGSADVTIALTLASTAVTTGSYGSATGVATFTVDSKGRLTAAGTTAIVFPVTSVAGKTGAVSITSADVADATSNNTASTVVKRDASGNFAAGTITASLSGNASSANTASSASKLVASRNISHSGDATGSAGFDGSADITIPITLSTSGVTAGTYGVSALVVDSKGRITNAIARTITGTASQIVVGNGDSVSGNPTVGIASDAILPGTGGFVPPVGTTAQRPSSPVTGQTRYNSDLGKSETWDGSDWVQPATASGSTSAIQYNNSGSIAGAASATIDSAGNLSILNSATPPTPSAGVTVYGFSQAGRSMLAAMSPTGNVQRLQYSLAANHFSWWGAAGNSTTSTAMNFSTTVSGTATARTVATTNMFTAARRLGFATAASAGSVAGFRSAGGAQFFRGNATGVGGFDFIIQFGVAALPAATSCRWVVGLLATTAAVANAEPSTLQNVLMFGAGANDTSINFYNNAASTSTVTSMGSSFPAKSTNTDLYEARIFAAPNSSTVGYALTNLTSGATTQGTASSNIPANTTLLCPQIAIITTVATAAAIDVVQLCIETLN